QMGEKINGIIKRVLHELRIFVIGGNRDEDDKRNISDAQLVLMFFLVVLLIICAYYLEKYNIIKH
ncbi:MAG: hypothetical protein ABSG42_00215, partial [Nitrospirota bacterium]